MRDSAMVLHPTAAKGAPAMDLRRDPVVIFWELTQACALACRHCRAEAQPKRHPLELLTNDCFRVMRDLAAFDRAPIVVLSGGDPFMRRDLFDIVAYGKSLGLIISVSPSATALVTKERLQRLHDLGVSRISISLDGSDAQRHDAFRGSKGSFQRTLDAMALAAEVGLACQVNTTVAKSTAGDLPEIAKLLETTELALWDLFFLVPTGRATEDEVLPAQDHEAVFAWLDDVSGRLSFPVKTTLGQHFRRVQLQKRLKEAGKSRRDVTHEQVRELHRGAATNDGKGILFISHLGDVYPSGFLPMSVGSVRWNSVVDVYRNSTVFRALRDPANLKGKCGRCPFNEVCGGCRARAYAVTGDPLESEPYCTFEPAGRGRPRGREAQINSQSNSRLLIRRIRRIAP